MNVRTSIPARQLVKDVSRVPGVGRPAAGRGRAGGPRPYRVSDANPGPGPPACPEPDFVRLLCGCLAFWSWRPRLSVAERTRSIALGHGPAATIMPALVAIAIKDPIRFQHRSLLSGNRRRWAIPPGEDPAQRIGRGAPVGPGREGAQPGLVALAEEGDGHETIRPADDGRHRQRRDVGQGVPLGAVAPRSPGLSRGSTRDGGCGPSMRGFSAG